jgi:DNA repair photolyase
MLFPEINPSGLIGIARLASESELLEQKRRVEYREITARRFIGRCSGERMPFGWTINPYRGCEFGCKYCYARYTHEFMELHETELFERRIFAKRFDAVRFRREVARIPKGESIAIGTATDPYQPAERRFGVTRAVLSVLSEDCGRAIHLATKSDLVARDADLFTRIAERNAVNVSVTITTADPGLARVLEPFAPRPDLRFAAIRTLTNAAVRVSVLACPLMPLINDSVANLSAVAAAAADAGASYLYGNPLFLKPCAQKAFFPMLAEHFPHLVRRYRERYEKYAYLRGSYVEIIRSRLESVRVKYGLNHRRERDALNTWIGDSQLSLFETQTD